MQPNPQTNAQTNAQTNDDRPTRRERRHQVRRTFGTKLLTTFTILFGLVLFAVFASTRWVMNRTMERVLEGQVTQHL